MASIRIGIKSEFNLVDSKVGIGTTNPTETMDVRGQIYSDNSIGAGGISTVTTYQGFLDTKQTIKSSVSEGTVVAGSLSGEITGKISFLSWEEMFLRTFGINGTGFE